MNPESLASMNVISELKNTISRWKNQNKYDIRSFRAPGRINLIGEHVDYLGGFVLPAAISFQITACIRKNDSNSFRFYSREMDEIWESREITKGPLWTQYIMGVVSEFQKKGIGIPGFDLAISGDIPPGAGLSSSAALEVVTCFALTEVFDIKINKVELAMIAQSAERNFVGTNCGIMDQFASVFGKKNHCILLNTENLDYHYKKISLPDTTFFLMNSNRKHSLADGNYNQKRNECESALEKLQKRHSTIMNLYTVPDDWESYSIDLTSEEKLKVIHAKTENLRTKLFLQAIENNDKIQAGNQITETHWSLSKNFGVSCQETDFLVSELIREGALGARMMGGGFGGCILVLANSTEVERITTKVQKVYFEKFHLDSPLYQIEMEDGVSEIILE
jgi:galactokinase